MKKLTTLVALTASALLAQAAQAEIVVIVNPKSAAASMTAEQVASVFLGKDSSMSPLDQKDAAIRNQFYEKVAGKDMSQVKAIWARLVFTGTQQPPKELGSSAEVVKQVASSDKAIGYVDKSAVDGSVKTVLTLN